LKSFYEAWRRLAVTKTRDRLEILDKRFHQFTTRPQINVQTYLYTLNFQDL